MSQEPFHRQTILILVNEKRFQSQFRRPKKQLNNYILFMRDSHIRNVIIIIEY